MQEKPLLADFAACFEAYWSGRVPSREAYIALFLPPSLEWFREYASMTARTPETSADAAVVNSLWSDLRQRLDWDFYAAFTYASPIGRTLEKTGCAVACVPMDRIDLVAARLHESARNRIERLRACTAGQCTLFLLGFLRHLRSLGAVYHNARVQTYVEKDANFFYISSKCVRWLPQASQRAKQPVFLSQQPWKKENFEAIARAGGKTWCLRWAHKVFTNALAMLGDNEALELYDIALSLLRRSGIVEEASCKGQRIWGLGREALRLSCRVCRLQCTQCGHGITVDEDEVGFWVGAPCVRGTCQGQYTQTDVTPGFYASLYAHGEVYRLFTAEHTGLLEREERQKTEQSFKRGSDSKDKAVRLPWDINLLSCTPTLEMGIDIGNLSSTIQCSVPPTQANYLQRTGRAGRQNGNAISITVAAGAPHDLYFFARPELMLRGEVRPPAIFLNAAAVLERQLTAFCIDRWIVQGTDSVGIPHTMDEVLQTQKKIRKGTISDDELRRRFPYTLLEFIRRNATDLHRDFVALFPQLEQETVAYLKTSIMGSENFKEPPLFSKVVEALAREEREAAAYDSRRRKLLRHRQEINKQLSSGQGNETLREEQKELSKEIDALGELYKNAFKRQVFEFLADESFLPNYAFPEHGVTLHSLVYTKRETAKPTDSPYETTEFSYQRSAACALQDFAPGSDFYASKRKVTITKVDLTTSGWSATGEASRKQAPEQDCLERWRVCPDCSYMERSSVATAPGPCPRCGCELFADGGQVCNLLRMSKVFASTADRDSRVDDSSENRSTTRYVKNLFMDYERADCQRVFRLNTDATIFAFAYISKASFREINFGQPSAGEQMSIAGRQVPREGFHICRYCGCDLSCEKARHDWGCKGATAEEQSIMPSLYLYRHFVSEAVKILLPFSEGERSIKLESFIAAFNMGMKLQFGGALEHLQTTLHTEPDGLGNGLQRQFLVVYDTVPGGTGYLKQLMQGSVLVDILELALKHLEQCDCEGAPGQDGCYACLRAYRNSARSASISKHTAVEMLRPIVNNKNTLQEIASLEGISVISNFESELEQEFMEALRRSSTAERPIAIKNELIHGKTGFFLSIGQQHWLMELQVDLGPEQGVCVPSRADFVFSPARTAEGIRPLVLFTDGWMWHKDRIGKDMEQRSAIVHSGKYWVWSLTWEDVRHVIDPSTANAVAQDVPEFVEPRWDANAEKLLKKLAVNAPMASSARTARVQGKSSMDILLDFLAKPCEASYRLLARVYAMLQTIFYFTQPPAYLEGLAQLDSVFEHWAHPDDLRMQSLQRHHAFTGYWGGFGDPNKLEGLALLHFADDGAVTNDEDTLRKTWKGFLRAANVFQFLPLFAAYGSSGSGASYVSMYQQRQNGPESPEQGMQEEEWHKAAELLLRLPGEETLFVWLHDQDFRVPVIGYPITADDDRVQGELEMAWPDMKIGITNPDDMPSAQAARALGWRILPLDEAVQHPEILLEWKGV